MIWCEANGNPSPQEDPVKLVVSGTGEYYEGEPITKLLGVATSLGVPFIDVWYPKNTRVEGLERSARLIAESGLQVVCVSTWTHLYWPGDASGQQELLIEGIEVAQRLGASIVNTYFGHGHVLDDERAIDGYLANLRPCLERAEALGVTLCLENEFDVLGDDPQASDITRRPERIRQLVRRVDSEHFRLTFDPCNFYFAGVEPYPFAYEVLKDWIGYVHLKDGARYDHSRHAGMLRYTDHSGEYVCLPLGQGAINTEGLLGRLTADGYSGYFVLEPHVEEARVADTYVQSQAYVNSLGTAAAT
jgi:sugar phosphate isomerase/epimerase